MAISIKALLLKKNDNLGNGLRSIREYENEMIDISEFEDGISDATTTTNPHFIIKDDVVYKVIKTYFDLDKNTRLFLCKESTEPMDKLEEKQEELDTEESEETITEEKQ